MNVNLNNMHILKVNDSERLNGITHIERLQKGEFRVEKAPSLWLKYIISEKKKQVENKKFFLDDKRLIFRSSQLAAATYAYKARNGVELDEYRLIPAELDADRLIRFSTLKFYTLTR